MDKREAVKKFLYKMQLYFPYLTKDKDVSHLVEAWLEDLEECSVDSILSATRDLFKHTKREYKPVDLIEYHREKVQQKNIVSSKDERDLMRDVDWMMEFMNEDE